MIDGRKIDVKPVETEKAKEKANNLVVLLKNLSFKSREKDIREFFAEFEISKVHVVKDGDQPKGYAFVEFSKLEDMNAALAMKEGVMNNRKFIIIKSNRDITSENPNKHSGQTQGEGMEL